jgi:hypothetical protein
MDATAVTVTPRTRLARRAATACVTAGLALVLGVAPASAGIKTVSNSVMIAPQRIGSVTATCPTNTTPVSAGFTSNFSFTAGGIFPYASSLVGPGSRTTGENGSGTLTRTLTGFAYCDTKARRVHTRSAKVVLAPDQGRTQTVLCPSGMTPISGGYRFTNKGAATGAAVMSRMVAGGWQVEGYNSGPGPSTFAAFAYCQRNGPRLVSSGQHITLPQFGSGSVEAACPNDTRLISGGFNGHFKRTGLSIRVALTVSSRRVHNAWRVKASAANSPTVRLTSYVYCERL